MGVFYFHLAEDVDLVLFLGTGFFGFGAGPGNHLSDHAGGHRVFGITVMLQSLADFLERDRHRTIDIVGVFIVESELDGSGCAVLDLDELALLAHQNALIAGQESLAVDGRRISTENAVEMDIVNAARTFGDEDILGGLREIGHRNGIVRERRSMHLADGIERPSRPVTWLSLSHASRADVGRSLANRANRGKILQIFRRLILAASIAALLAVFVHPLLIAVNVIWPDLLRYQVVKLLIDEFLDAGPVAIAVIRLSAHLNAEVVDLAVPLPHVLRLDDHEVVAVGSRDNLNSQDGLADQVLDLGSRHVKMAIAREHPFLLLSANIAAVVDAHDER